MICPYIQNTSYEEQENILDEENPEFIGTIKTKRVFGNAECVTDKCAVWIDGRCRYNG